MSTTAFVAGILMVPTYAHADPANSWDYDVVLDGNVGKDTTVVGITDITVTGGNGFVEGNADIYTGHTVNVTGDNGATFAYRDNRDNIESTLNGNLNSNMKIVIIDKDGVFFGSGSQIDVQSIVTTTGSVSVADIMDGGQLEITDVDQGGDITLNGSITVAEAGLAAFVAPNVTNNGVINAKLARVQMGAAQTVTVDLYGDGLLELTLDGQLADALLENNGDVLAEGGFVQMTALAAKSTVDKIVNNTGLITVASATQVGGKIILSGGTQGTVAVSGTLDATGTSGGEIEVRGKRIIATGAADIDASGTAGAGGKVTLQTDKIFFPVASAFIKANGAGGTVQIERLTQGRVSVGNKSGGLRVSQATVDKIEAENLVIGNASASENNITEINVRTIDTTASISGLVQLNALSYIPGDETHKNEGDVEFDSGTNRFNTLEVNAADDVNFRKDVIVETLVGDMVFNADVDATDATGDTNIIEFLGDGATLNSAGDITFSGTDYVDVYDSTSITANTVNFERSKVGTILLGGAITETPIFNDMQIDQGELDNILANSLVIGNRDAAENNVSEINVNKFDTTASISGLVQMNSLSYIPGGGHKNEGDVEFDKGTNSFNILEVNARDDVIFRTNVTVETLVGDMVFNADVDSDDATGDTNIIDFLGNGGATISSAGDITFSAQDYVDLHDTTAVIANSGTGTVNFKLSSNGTIALGDIAGDMQIDQGELDNISAGTLNVGNPVAVDSNTTDIDVNNADISHINNVNLYALAASTVNYSGVNNFVNLNTNTSPTTGVINVLNGFVNATTSIHFNAPLVNLNGDLDAPSITGTATIVNVQSDAAEIQDGIDVATYYGATVNVAAGTFVEDVNVYKEVTLLGANAGNAGSGPRAPESLVTPTTLGFNITADNVTLDGFKIKGGNTGVRVDSADNASIVNNIVTGSGKHAIEAYDADDLDIKRNKITYAGWDGIHVDGGAFANIVGNNIYHVGADGIDVDGQGFLNISYNRINKTGQNHWINDAHGIEVSDSIFVNIGHNRVTNAADDGINVEHSAAVGIHGNTIKRSGDDGIDVGGSLFVDISYNKIDGTGSRWARDANGIEVSNSGLVSISHNRIKNADDDGIDVGTSAFVDIHGNTIKHSGDDGIDVDSSIFVGVNHNTIIGADDNGIEIVNSFGTNVIGNGIYHVGENGVYAYHSAGTNVSWNDIYDAGANGVYLSGSDFSSVKFNTISNVGEHGIKVNPSDFVNIIGNSISYAGWDGINVQGGIGANIVGNRIYHVGADGIDVDGNNFLNISYNKINGTGENHWVSDANGIEVSGSKFVNIGHNRIKHADDDGIDVEHSAFVGIHGNTIKYSGDDGIDVDSSFLVSVKHNTIVGADDNGIEIVNSFGTNVIGNGIYHVGENGVYAYHSAGTNVAWNDIYDADANGIYLSGSDYSSANFNTISHVGEHGIKVNPSDFVDIIGNSISYAGWDGINVQGGIGADIIGNRIYHVGADGIDVDGNNFLNISYNKINKTGQNHWIKDAHGIEVSDSAFVNIGHNRVTNAADDGINVEHSALVGIHGNTIKRSGDDGIDVDGSIFVDISYNKIDGTGKSRWARDANGIEVSDSGFVNIGHNRIKNADDDGIDVEYSGLVSIHGNTIKHSGDDGIDVDSSDYVSIRRNRIFNSDDNGIELVDSYDVNITGNKIIKSENDGILILSGDNIDVRRNDIRRSGGNGIAAYDVGGYLVPVFAKSEISEGGDYGYGLRIVNNDVSNSGHDGVHVENSADVRILRNDIDESGNDGIYVSGTEFYYPEISLQDGPSLSRITSESGYSSVVISDNIVSNSGGDGIQTANIDNLTLTGNEVSYSYGNGVYVSGAYNGDVLFQGNTLTDNGHLSGSAGARFESGYIDMSDLENPNTFVNTTGLPAVAMQFDDISGGLVLSRETRSKELSEGYYDGTGLYIVNETLGSTVFDGYTPEGSFYVRFEDGAILDDVTGEPIIIDGTDASFDGIIPSLSGNILSADDLEFIEERLYDADDETIDGRGQIFVGEVEETDDPQSITNFQDFLFQQPSGDDAESTSASLEIRGLPSVGPFSNLNDIAPAAGGENAQDLANINPEAGGDDATSKDVTCLGDVLNSLSDGSVTYSFGGSLEESIAGASACATSAGA